MYTLTSYMKGKYDVRKDKDNIFGVGITDAEFREFIIDYLLGKDWYVVDPLSKNQINEIALYAILEKYSKIYREEKKIGRKRRMDDYVLCSECEECFNCPDAQRMDGCELGLKSVDDQEEEEE